MTFSTRCLLALAFAACSFAAQAQEYVRELRTNPVLQYHHHKPQPYNTQLRIGLPFVDDFSTSYVTADPAKWTGHRVYINATYPVNPPTIGVATFDGLDYNGVPYNIQGNLSPQHADTLTSVAIDLGALLPTDTVFMSFFFEPQGLGDFPNVGDSLMLEFLNADTNWVKVWSLDGFTSTPPAEFVQEIIPVTDASFLHSDFKIRFRNKAAVVGNNDHWHIDYVKVAVGYSAHTTINDVAVQYPPEPLLNLYSRMPWNQFKANPANELAPNVTLSVRNNFSTTKNTSYGYLSEDLVSGTTLSNPPLTSFNFGAYTNEVLSLPTPDLSSVLGNENVVIKTTYFASATGDVLPANDTVVHYQNFENELAYDDGSAERAYGLNGIGAQGALRFHVNTPDTLQAIRIMWAHVDEDQSNLLFTPLVWKTLNDPPVHTGVFEHIKYLDSINGFATYLLTPPVPVTDTFYIGWVQDNQTIRDMGLDRNTNSFAQFRFNIGAGWQNSVQTGTPMIRAVLGSRDGVYNTGVEDANALPSWSTYPNPVNDWVNVQGAPNNSRYQLYDASGRLLLQGKVLNERIDLPDLSQSVYVLRVTSGGATRTFKLVKP